MSAPPGAELTVPTFSVVDTRAGKKAKGVVGGSAAGVSQGLDREDSAPALPHPMGLCPAVGGPQRVAREAGAADVGDTGSAAANPVDAPPSSSTMVCAFSVRARCAPGGPKRTSGRGPRRKVRLARQARASPQSISDGSWGDFQRPPTASVRDTVQPPPRRTAVHAGVSRNRAAAGIAAAVLPYVGVNQPGTADPGLTSAGKSSGALWSDDLQRAMEAAMATLGADATPLAIRACMSAPADLPRGVLVYRIHQHRRCALHHS